MYRGLARPDIVALNGELSRLSLSILWKLLRLSGLWPSVCDGLLLASCVISDSVAVTKGC